VTLHLTTTSGSWLNMVGIFFGIITKQAIRRGTFRSVRDLQDAIRAFIDGWNDRCEPVRLDQRRRDHPGKGAEENYIATATLVLRLGRNSRLISRPHLIPVAILAASPHRSTHLRLGVCEAPR
jgi:hypothetical protein